jgi:hypothetical protein
MNGRAQVETRRREICSITSLATRPRFLQCATVICQCSGLWSAAVVKVKTTSALQTVEREGSYRWRAKRKAQASGLGKGDHRAHTAGRHRVHCGHHVPRSAHQTLSTLYQRSIPDISRAGSRQRWRVRRTWPALGGGGMCSQTAGPSELLLADSGPCRLRHSL